MKYFLSFLGCLIFSLSLAEELKAPLQEYANKISTVKTLQSDFTEEKHLSLLDQPILSQGRLIFDKNAQQLLWKYQKPFENGFYIEKGQAYHLQGTEKKVVTQSVGRLLAMEMIVWLTLDFEQLKQKYTISLNGTEIMFAPIQKDHKLIQKITVWLDKKDPRLVTQVRMEEPNGDFIIWKFNNTQLNIPLTQEVFP